jgi:hypothetical protein
LRKVRKITQKLQRTIFLKSAEVDLVNLGYLQYPEFWAAGKIRDKNRTRYLGGDWDQVLTCSLNWSAAYEPPPQGVQGMLPLECFTFYTSLCEHFLNGCAWEATDWYAWISKHGIEKKIKRYQNDAEIRSRLSLLDRLFEDFRTGRYLEANATRPFVNIGRNGKLAIEDGRHRLCVAKIADVKAITVNISIIHEDLRMKGKH